MLFKPYLAEAILQGKKTQTRRLIIPATAPAGTTATATHTGTVLYDSHIIATYQNRRLRWRVGNTYAIQPGRGKKAVGRFRLLSIRQEPLQAISYQDAKSEGMSHPPTLHILGFVQLPAPCILAFFRLWNSVHTKLGTRWQDNPQVFVLTFELVTPK